MFESLFGGFDTDIFDEFKRLESEMLQLFGSSPWPAGIRAMQRGAFPPLNVGTTPERARVTAPSAWRRVWPDRILSASGCACHSERP